VISGENPDQGPDGNSSGFSPDPFGMGWTLLTKINGGSSPTLFDGVSFSWSLTSAGPERNLGPLVPTKRSSWTW
jgi:hypothetical protein